LGAVSLSGLDGRGGVVWGIASLGGLDGRGGVVWGIASLGGLDGLGGRGGFGGAGSKFCIG